MTTIKQPFYRRFLLPAAVLACWFVLMTFPVESFDFYYHLATGRWIADHGTVPTHDVFSSTARGVRWVTHEWAVQLGMYLKYRMGGIPYLLIMKSLWLTMIPLLFWILGYRLGSPPLWTALLLTAAAPAVAFRAFLRPHALSYGFMAILLCMLYGNVPKTVGKRTLCFGILFLVWANCHSGFVFGLFVLFTGSLFKAFESDRWIRRLLPPVCAAAAALINPNTWHVYLYPFRFIRHSELFGLISELRPITTPSFQGGWFIPLFYGLLLAGTAIFLRRIRHGALFELVLLAVFGIWACRSVRNVPLATVVLLPGLMLHGGTLWREWGANVGNRWIRMAAAGLVLAMPMGLIYASFNGGIPIDGRNRRTFGVGVSDLSYPAGAVKYLKEHTIRGNMFNTFAFGGYLLWEMYPDPGVFIDGRLFVFMGTVMDDYRRVIGGGMPPDVLHEKYDVTHLVLAYPDSATSETRGIYAALKENTEWIPVFWDDITMVFIRDDGLNSERIAADGYRVIHPLRRKLSEIDDSIQRDPDGALREALRAEKTTPGNTAAMIILARCYGFQGDDSRSRQYYEKVLGIHPENRLVRRQYALTLMRMNAFQDAENQWRRVIRDGGDDGFVRLNLGICLHRQRQLEAAMMQYRRALQTGFRSAELMNVMGIYWAQNGDMSQAVEYWKRGLRLDPDHQQLQNNLARAEAGSPQ